MDKSNYFFGQSVFGQLISLIDSNLVSTVVRDYQSDFCTKRFTTHDHLTPRAPICPLEARADLFAPLMGKVVIRALSV